MNSWNSNEYAAKAGSIKIENITSRHQNQNVLRQLRDNDPALTTMIVRNDEYSSKGDYCPDNIGEMGWLGYFIGKNKYLLELKLDIYGSGVEELVVNEDFCSGLSQSTSIQKLEFFCLSGGELLRMLGPFFKQNHNLTEVIFDNCRFDAEGYQLMAMTIGGCSGSLTKFSIVDDDGLYDAVCIPLALSMHPKLKEIVLDGIYVGRNTCVALATLLKNTTTELAKLDIHGDGVDDAGVIALSSGLHHCKKLSTLTLGGGEHETLSKIGCQSLSSLLESPSSNLKDLRLYFSGIGADGALKLANSLGCNHKLKSLSLYGMDISTEVWPIFTKLVCDTTSVTRTFQSNHTLTTIDPNNKIPYELRSLLCLNAEADKKEVAMTKILKHHPHFNMEPFFEWDLKVLPLMISWFERAALISIDFDARIDDRKLSSIYQFVRGMPMISIESWSGLM